ncbi:MAG: serine--tRNA ligase [Candidatus Dormibacteraeota bacterium]|nr:serine--tRNA ligase [Candidatus Dormibacteraeota bacterium]
MIPLQRLREEPDVIRDGALRKGESAPIDEILQLDARARQLRAAVEAARAEQNRASDEIRGAPTDEQRARLFELKQVIQNQGAELSSLDARIDELLLLVPNPPHASVPIGVSSDDNVILRTWGEPARYEFEPRPHYDIGEMLGLFDFERGVKLSGSRFVVLKGDGARLQRALIAFMLDIAVREHGYSEIAPPYLVRPECMVGTANLPDKEGMAYATRDDDLYLIPTAEVPVTNLYREEILEASELPIAHAAFTPCFRREAGAAGADTRGYVRLHQFDKVEMVRFTTPERSLDELELLTQHAETVLQRLGIMYRVLLMCTGDMGFAQWKKYDIEAWAPGMERFLEVSSCSAFGDFQARRANIRYRSGPGAKPQFVHTLNGSGLAVPRTLDALLETYQQRDGSVRIPDALRPYMANQDRIAPPLTQQGR